VDILTVLKSEIFNFSNNDLAYIRIVNNDEYIYKNIKYILNLNCCVENRVFLNDEFSITYDRFKILYDKCMFFVGKINEYREKSLFMKIDEFIWFIYKDSKYYFLLSTMEDGLTKQSNLRIIFNKAKEFRVASFSGLFNFIEYLKYSKKFGDDILVPKNISENENVVRIMSIHKSKGLEFPVVILCNTSGRFNFKDLNNSIILHDEFG
ncbi:ATP-dependent helicase/nuclease subunit A, partial [Candidatus Arthromitus sp. SFB-1]